MNTSLGRLRLQPLTPASLPLLAALAADAESARVLGITLAPGEGAGPAAHRWMDSVVVETRDARSHALAISDGDLEGGVVALRSIGGGGARLTVAVQKLYRRLGAGSFAAEQMLLHAFQSLRLIRVTAKARDEAGVALLVTQGFRATNAATGEFSLTRAGWSAHRNAPAINALHPGLRTVLSAELAAGNEIVETGRGWPDADSVLVKLRKEFATAPTELPAGVGYQLVNDPHWWIEEFASAKPRHLLVR